MSFKQNDSNDKHMIHLGNYEEYFILYLDNELSDDQMKMVDAFLSEHHDLQGEFELLANTRLPLEELNINKEELMAENMRLNTVDEKLLLYIDNELTTTEKKNFEREIKSNKDFQLQRELLMKTRLDASELVVYPNKKELYRKEEGRKVIAIAPWLRIAASVIIIALAGVVYYSNTPKTGTNPEITANQEKPKFTENKTTTQTADQVANAPKTDAPKMKNESNHSNSKTNEQPDVPKDVLNQIVKVDKQNQQIIKNSDDPAPLTDKTNLIEGNTFSDKVAKATVVATPSQINNNNSVTSALANRKTEEGATEKTNNTDVASNKGSVKGFLRKATRVIEKRTGVDPTSDGELLIGAVAINLK